MGSSALDRKCVIQHTVPLAQRHCSSLLAVVHRRRRVVSCHLSQVTFSVNVRSDAPRARHVCTAVVLCGLEAVTMEFGVVVSDLRDVYTAAGVAAASASRRGGMPL